MEKKKYNSIDLFKFIMAFCVIALHTGPLEGCTIYLINTFYSTFVCMAVPFFFIASGFLLAKKMQYPFCLEENRVIIVNYMKKVIRLYLVWTVIYFPLALIHFVSRKENPIRAVLIYIRGFFLVGHQYNSWHLWYMLSTIYALAIILFLLKKRQSIQRIILFGFVCFLVGTFITYLTTYYEGNTSKLVEIVKKILVYSVENGRIFSGIFYIPIGMLLSKETIRKQVFWVFLIAGFIANFMIDNQSISTLFEAVSSIGLFGVIEKIKFADSKVFPFVRKMSTFIYFIHMYVWSFYYVIIYRVKTYGWDSFLVTSVVSSILAIVYIYARKSVWKSAAQNI